MEVISVVKCLFLTYQVEGQYKRGIFAILCELPAQLLTCSCCHSAGRYNAFLYMICLSGIGVLGQPTPRALESWGGVNENCLFRPRWSPQVCPHPKEYSAISCSILFCGDEQP